MWNNKFYEEFLFVIRCHSAGRHYHRFVKLYYLSVDVLSPRSTFSCCPVAKFVTVLSGSDKTAPSLLFSSRRPAPSIGNRSVKRAQPVTARRARIATAKREAVAFLFTIPIVFSYAQEKTLMATVTEDSQNELQLWPLHSVHIAAKSSAAASGGGSSLKLGTPSSSWSTTLQSTRPHQPLCQCAKVQGHLVNISFWFT
jgi:hypothetical protein